MKYDAAIVGAGPNGLAAGVALARRGKKVAVFERNSTIGGGCRSAELTLPGFVHDVCSAIHPLGKGSPFFRTLPLDQYGLQWIHPDACVAHPMDDGTAAMLYRSLGKTAAGLKGDGAAYRKLVEPVVRDWSRTERSVLGPPALPRHPLALARFGMRALLPTHLLALLLFRGEHARGLFAGISAHSMLRLEQPASAAAGLVLSAMAHIAGWPMSRGGSQQIANALARYLESLGSEIMVNSKISSLSQLPRSGAVLFDLPPRHMASIAGSALPQTYRQRLKRFRHAPGVFKIDYALDGPMPWRARECLQAGTVHLGGTLDEIAASEREVWEGKHPERPFVLTAQQSLFDPTRAPKGKHTLWAYCHVPAGSHFNMTERIEAQIERFAPGFQKLILARHTMGPTEMEAYNPNYIGGDISGGVQDLRQLYTRPLPQMVPYKTANPRLFICSSSTPPGGGVHGLCGYFSARAALREMGE